MTLAMRSLFESIREGAAVADQDPLPLNPAARAGEQVNLLSRLRAIVGGGEGAICLHSKQG